MKRSSLNRRLFLLSLASSGALAACAQGGSGSPPVPMPVLPGASPGPSGTPSTGTIGSANTLNINNTTTYPNTSINVYVVGQDPQSGAWSSLQKNGSLAPLSSSPAQALPLSAQLTTTFPLPYLHAARIYFAVGGTLNIAASGGGAVQPAGWVSSDPSYKTLFDWIEYDYTAATGLFCNTTQVDMLGLPFTIQLGANNAPASPMVGIDQGLRSAIFAAVRALGAPFSNLIVSSGGTDLRIIHPGFGVESGLFPATYLDAYIQSVWTYYQTNTMTLDSKAFGIWSGKVSGGTFTFTQSGQPSVTIAQPSTHDALQCAGPLASGSSPAASRIQALIAAGLNRGTLLTGTNQPNFTSSAFYQSSPIHQYAKIMHMYNLTNRSYSFAYDDEGGFDTTIGSTVSGLSLNVGLSSF